MTDTTKQTALFFGFLTAAMTAAAAQAAPADLGAGRTSPLASPASVEVSRVAPSTAVPTEPAVAKLRAIARRS